MHFSANDGLMTTTSGCNGAEAGQSVGEHRATRCKVLAGPFGKSLRGEPRNRCDFGVDRMACIIQRDGGDDRYLDLQSSTWRAARSFSAKVSIIHFDLSEQHIGILSLAHRLHDLVVQQPGAVVVHSQMTAQLEGGDAGFGLAVR